MKLPDSADTQARLNILQPIGIEDDFLFNAKGQLRRRITKKTRDKLYNKEKSSKAMNLIKKLRNLFVPPSCFTTKAPKWISYAKVKRYFDKEIINGKAKSTGVERERRWSTVSPAFQGWPNPHIHQLHLWAYLLLGGYGLGVSWSDEELYNAILLDIDLYDIDKNKSDFYSLDPDHACSERDDQRGAAGDGPGGLTQSRMAATGSGPADQNTRVVEWPAPQRPSSRVAGGRGTGPRLIGVRLPADSITGKARKPDSRKKPRPWADDDSLRWPGKRHYRASWR
jgi:hypothetical protein